MNDCCGSCEICDPKIRGNCSEDARFAQETLNEAAAEKDAEIERLREKAKAYVVATKHLNPCPGTLADLEQALAGGEG